jgi:hypothetical protein
MDPPAPIIRASNSKQFSSEGIAKNEMNSSLRMLLALWGEERSFCVRGDGIDTIKATHHAIELRTLSRPVDAQKRRRF